MGAYAPGNPTEQQVDAQPPEAQQDIASGRDEPGWQRVRTSSQLARIVSEAGRRPQIARSTWLHFESVSLAEELQFPVATIRDPPRWFRGNLRRAYVIALQEYRASRSAASWTLFELIPRMLLRPTAAKGQQGRKELEHRMDRFLRGEWTGLLADARDSTRGAGGPPASTGEVERRRQTACDWIRMGQVSRARQSLMAPALAPGNDATLSELRNTDLRPAQRTEELPEAAMNLQPQRQLRLSRNILTRALRTAKRGSAPGLSGTRMEHLKVLLEDDDSWDWFGDLAEAYARADVPDAVAEGLALGRLTALSKPGGRVRGIVTGASFRRVVSRALAMQFAAQFDAATSPFQFALSTRAGTDAVGHALKAVSDNDPGAVILSLDGIGAYDHIKRASMLRGIASAPPLHGLLPFVRMIYGRQSKYVWQDAHGVRHEIVQGEGGEQGDPLMPALYALGQHQALQEAQAALHEGEFIFAFLDDLYVVTSRERAYAAFATVAEAVERVAGVRTHLGKLRAWSRSGGDAPPGLEALGAEVWTANKPAAENGIKVLGTPLGSPEFVQAHANARMQEEQRFLDEIPHLQDLQCSWALLAYSAVPRANHLIRVLQPVASQGYACAHDDALWSTLRRLLELPADGEEFRNTRRLASLPAKLGGVGLRSAWRIRDAAYWAAWADALPVLQRKLPTLAARALEQLELGARSTWPCACAAHDAAVNLHAAGFGNIPSWRDLRDGARPPQQEDIGFGEWERGWQYHASRVLEQRARDSEVLQAARPAEQAMIRSQSGPGAGRWLYALPTQPATTLPPRLMQTALRRRLRLPLEVCDLRCSGASCRRPLDVLGDHRAACPRSGLLKRRAKPLERCWARVFREAGASVAENRYLRDTNIPTIAAGDDRRLEVVARGTPLFHGMPLGCDATLVAPLHADGRARPHAATEDGIAIEKAEHDKRTTYPELVESHYLRLVVLACEVGGRWSSTCQQVVQGLAAFRAESAPRRLQGAARMGFEARWWAILSVAQQSTLAASLLDGDAAVGLDASVGGPPLLTEVLEEDCFGGMDPSRLPLRC